ncbi:MAG: cation:proton antiporter [Kofleriaceae bacterium]|nr:cation:proton antiporter [Myxococcales bacterium]MCB9565257.1 cation:proton antiporter [Kofleriaceae bacterium]MCB9572381.1 cation:proton antiporter [Kofleriaceae bacterium]
MGADGGGVDANVFIAIAVMLAAAKLFGDLFERLSLPPVLGELFAGIVLGNLDLLGFGGLHFIEHDPQLELLAELGVVLLLFQVGLESNLAQMAKVGASAFVVAVVGVILPMAMGYGLHAVLVPDRTWHTHLFIGAVLSATSVGITARVFKDLGKIDSPTGRVVLGAAVIDDVLGLIVLAVVTGVVEAAETGGSLDVVSVSILVAKAIGFLGLAILLGRPVSSRLYKMASALRVKHVLLAASLAFCLVISWFAHLVGLATIVGAFAAGLVLDEVVFQDLQSREMRRLEEMLEPLAELLTPMFFVLTGAKVDLAAFGNIDALALAGALTVAAIIGKQACSLVAFGPGVHKTSVGLGMIPRGEVGLIFAAVGLKLNLGGQPVISDTTYAAIVLMVMFTTMVTPPVLAWSLRRAGGETPAAGPPDEAESLT